MKILLFERDIKSIPFNTRFISYKGITSLLDEGFIDISGDEIENLIQDVGIEIHKAVNAESVDIYRIKKNLVRSRPVVMRQWPAQKCYEYVFDENSARLDIETHEEGLQQGRVFLSLSLKRLPRASSEYDKTIARRFRAEESMYRIVEPVLDKVASQYETAPYDTDERDRWMHLFLREVIVGMVDEFIDDAMQSFYVAPALITPEE